MFIALFPRIGTPHIFNFQLSNGQLRTICGKNITKDHSMIVLAGDQMFPGLCPICSHQVDGMYKDDLEGDPRMARNSWQSRLESLRDYHYQEVLGPAAPTYEMINRSWNKLSRAKKVASKKRK